MADRPIIFPGQLGRDYDLLHGWRDAVKALGQFAGHFKDNLAIAAGGTPFGFGTELAGFIASQSGTPDLNVNLTEGFIYQSGPVDASQYGSLASGADASEAALTILQQGRAAAQAIALSPPPTAGKWRWALIQAAFSQSDAVRAGDPSTGVLPYYNSSSPNTPLAGPAGAGTVQSTVRSGGVNLQVIYGAEAASAGAAVPPTASSGFVPMYLVLLQQGQTAITNAMIAVAAPNATSNGGTAPGGYAQAPFMQGLHQQHHLGIAGSGPKIDGAKEWLPGGPVPNNSQKITQLLSGTASGEAVHWGQFPFTANTNGYFRLPNGLQVNWAFVNASFSALAPGGVVGVTGTWAQAFPNNMFHAQANTTSQAGLIGSAYIVDQTSFNVQVFNAGAGSPTGTGVWVFAIGN